MEQSIATFILSVICNNTLSHNHYRHHKIGLPTLNLLPVALLLFGYATSIATALPRCKLQQSNTSNQHRIIPPVNLLQVITDFPIAHSASLSHLSPCGHFRLWLHPTTSCLSLVMLTEVS